MRRYHVHQGNPQLNRGKLTPAKLRALHLMARKAARLRSYGVGNWTIRSLLERGMIEAASMEGYYQLTTKGKTAVERYAPKPRVAR